MWPFGRMIMCHMISDSEDELDEMAVKLGIRKWKQIPDRSEGVGGLIHYDISKSKRKEAVGLGAIPLDTFRAEAKVLNRLAEGKIGMVIKGK